MADKQSERQINIDGGVQAVVGENRGTVNQYLQDIRHEIVLITPESVYQKYTLDRRSPYKALRRFDVDEAEYFQGRKQLIKELIEAIEGSNLALVLGASGSGKSSVVRAGLIPEFLRSGSHCHNFVLTPGENPFQSLYESLLGRYKVGKDNKYHFGESSSKVEFVQVGAGNEFTQIRTTLVEPNSKWLIFIDQFEELFTRCQSLEQQRAFIDSITEIAESEEDSIKIVLAMRADFLEQFTPYPQFGRIVQRNIHLVTDMYLEELELAIKYPAMLHGVTFEPGLVPRILENIQGQAGYLPLLQYTLHLLWDYECNKKENGIEDKVLNLDSYEELGGVRGALQKHIDSIYQQLGEEEQKAAKRIFMELVKLIETEDSRLVPVSQRAYRSIFKGRVLEKTLQTFIDEKLLVSSTESLTKEALQGEEGQNIQQSSTVEIAHEILLSSWSTLKKWIEESKDVLIVKSRLAEDMGRWHDMLKQNQEKANEELLVGSRLERVLELRQEGMFELREMPLKPEETQFIDASVEWRDRQLHAREEQIQKLNLALTETSLREKAARVLNLLATQPLDALVLSIQAMGENLDKLPQKILAPVQASLQISMEETIGQISTSFDEKGGDILSVSFSPDGRMIVSSSSMSKRICVWDLQGNVIEQAFKGHESYIKSVAFSPNSQMIVGGSKDGQIYLWNLKGNLEKVFYGHKKSVNSVAISSSDSDVFIVSGSDDQKINLWDLEGNLIQTFEGHEKGVNSVAFSSDGALIVSGGHDQKIGLWDIRDKSNKLLFQAHDSYVNSVSFSPNSLTIVSGSDDKTVRLWDANGKAIIEPLQHQDCVRSVAFSSDGKNIISGSLDKKIYLWNLEGKLIRQPFQGHNKGILTVAFSPDGTKIVSGSIDKTIRLWDLQGKRIRQPFQGHKDGIRKVIFSPDGKKIISGSGSNKRNAAGHPIINPRGDHTVRCWNLEGKSLGQFSQEHQDHIISLSWNLDSTRIISGGADKIICLWDLEGNLIQKNRFLPVRELGNSRMISMSFSPDETMIAIGSDKRQREGYRAGNILQLYSLDGKPIGHPFIEHRMWVTSVSFSPNNKLIISGDSAGIIYLWSLQEKIPIKSFKAHKNAVNSLDFTPDSQLIVSGGMDGKICLWDLDGNLIGQPFLGHQGPVNSVTFSSNGQLITSGGRDGKICLWDLDGNLIGQPFIGHQEQISSVAFSPDSQLLASGSDDRTVCLWRSHWRAWLQVCCDRLKYHSIFKNPQTDAERRAKATAEKYIYNPQIGAKELYDKATNYIKEKDFESAITLLHHAISCYPEYIQAYYQRGRIYYQLKCYFDAIKDFEIVLTKKTNFAQGYHYRGLSYLQINNLEKAKSDLQRASQLYQLLGKQKEAQQIQKYLNDYSCDFS